MDAEVSLLYKTKERRFRKKVRAALHLLQHEICLPLLMWEEQLSLKKIPKIFP